MNDENPSRHETTAILDEAAGLSGEVGLRRPAAIVYGELRQLAATHLRKEHPEHTLQPTALLNEPYLRLFGTTRPPGEPRVPSSALRRRLCTGSSLSSPGSNA